MSKLYIEKEWITEDGYLALVTLTPMGHRCGYVVVNKNHPAYGKEYYTFTDSEPINPTEQAINNIEVHGGLTYADKLKFKVEHVTEPKEDTWVFGFDAGHLEDIPDRAAVRELYKDNQEVLDRIVEVANGDLRSAINDLQKFQSNKEVSSQELSALVVSRDVEYEVIPTLEGIFKARSIKEAMFALRSSSVDYNMVLRWLSENISRVIKHDIEREGA